MARVKKINKVTHAPVFDIEVPDTHNFVANGMVVHNCHHVPAETFANTATIFPAKLRMGLSATVDRSDGKEIVLFAHIGPVRVQAENLPMTPRVLQIISDWKCPVVTRTTEQGEKKKVKLPHSPGKCGHVVNIIAKDHSRNNRMMNLVSACYKKGRKTIVFSDRTEHLDTMHQMLTQLGVPNNDIGYYVGGMKEAELDASKGKAIILATYGMMAEGTNIPWMDTCALMTPRSDVRQTVGRVLREYPGKTQPLVLDPIDNDSPVFAGYAKSRRQWYGSIGAPVQTVS